MMHPEERQGLDLYLDKPMRSSDGEEIGRVTRFLGQRVSGLPAWMVVDTKLIGGVELIVPVAGSSFEEDEVVSAYTRDRIENHPEAVLEEGVLSLESEEAMDRYYELGAADESGRLE